MQALEPAPWRTQSCLYTITADHDYIIGRVPGSPRIVLAGGGSGHAFKNGVRDPNPFTRTPNRNPDP